MFPQYAPSYTGLAQVYLKKDELDNAVIYLNKSLKIDPEFSAFRHLILAYLKLNQKEKAEAVFRQAEESIIPKGKKMSLRKFLEDKSTSLDLM